MVRRLDREILTWHRTSDDAALRAKVEEALNVYNEYLRNNSTQGSTEEPSQANGVESTGEASEEKA